jgi:hypothetical protein
MEMARLAPLSSALAEQGLNLQARFDVAVLPANVAAMLQAFDPERKYRQLILLGHGGRALWTTLKATGFSSADPIDDFSVAVVRKWLDREAGESAYRIIYPSAERRPAVPLQQLGRLAGWHHDSPLGVGINGRWGLWFAYRVALLADTDLPTTPAWTEPSPCTTCTDKPCIAHCPGQALTGGVLALDRCIGERKRPQSGCQATCSARLACPVGAEHRYDADQMRHHYFRSLHTLQKFY